MKGKSKVRFARFRGGHGVIKYLNVLELDRVYGGPEEGGWWFDTETPIKSIPFIVKGFKRIVTRDCWGGVRTEESYTVPVEIKKLQARLEQEYPNRHNVGSVNYSGGDYWVGTEDHLARHSPRCQPRYE